MEVTCKTGGNTRNCRRRKASSDNSFLLSQYTGVLIDGIDLAGRTDQIGQCQCEGSGSRAEIGPYSSWPRYSLAQQIYVIFVDHSISFGHNSEQIASILLTIFFKWSRLLAG